MYPPNLSIDSAYSPSPLNSSIFSRQRSPILFQLGLLLFSPIQPYQIWLATSLLAYCLLYIAISTFSRIYLRWVRFIPSSALHAVFVTRRARESSEYLFRCCHLHWFQLFYELRVPCTRPSRCCSSNASRVPLSFPPLGRCVGPRPPFCFCYSASFFQFVVYPPLPPTLVALSLPSRQPRVRLPLTRRHRYTFYRLISFLCISAPSAGNHAYGFDLDDDNEWFTFFWLTPFFVFLPLLRQPRVRLRPPRRQRLPHHPQQRRLQQQ